MTVVPTDVKFDGQLVTGTAHPASPLDLVGGAGDQPTSVGLESSGPGWP